MTTPQQPELARSRRSEVDPAAAKTRTGGPTTTKGRTGPVPEDNEPGHHPEEEQDKPKVRAARRPRGVRAAEKPMRTPAPAAASTPTTATPPPPTPLPTASQRYAFSFEPTVAPLSFAFGITPFTAWVEVTGDELHVRFGVWSVRTPLDNVEGAQVTGPYAWPKVAGPAHVSLRDRGLTFATSTRRGVCIRFRRPVRGAMPFGLLRHPALTVTVERPEELAARLAGGR
jgi:hypothetical protein